MPSSFSFRCPACNARIRAPFQLLGHLRPCPRCGRRLVVRPPLPEDAGPVLVGDERLTPASAADATGERRVLARW